MEPTTSQQAPIVSSDSAASSSITSSSIASSRKQTVRLTNHAIARASSRYQLSRRDAEKFVVSEILAAFHEGRVSVKKPRWARATRATHPMPGQSYAWDSGRSHAYVVDVSRQELGELRVITSLNAIAA